MIFSFSHNNTKCKHKKLTNVSKFGEETINVISFIAFHFLLNQTIAIPLGTGRDDYVCTRKLS